MLLLSIDNREVTENLDSHSVRQCFSWILIISMYPFNSIQKRQRQTVLVAPPFPTDTDRREGGGEGKGERGGREREGGKRGEGRREEEEGTEGKRQIKLPLTIKPKSYKLHTYKFYCI